MACARPPPLGICDYPSSRAVYAVDLMLKWDSHPDGEGLPQPNPIYSELILQPPRQPPRDREGALLPRPSPCCPMPLASD